jgi:hypothetical protein
MPATVFINRDGEIVGVGVAAMVLLKRSPIAANLAGGRG